MGQNKSCESVTTVVNVHSAAPTASRSSDRPHNGSQRFVLVHCSVTWMDEVAGGDAGLRVRHNHASRSAGTPALHHTTAHPSAPRDGRAETNRQVENLIVPSGPPSIPPITLFSCLVNNPPAPLFLIDQVAVECMSDSDGKADTDRETGDGRRTAVNRRPGSRRREMSGNWQAADEGMKSRHLSAADPQTQTHTHTQS